MRVVLADPDADWPLAFARHEARIRSALGDGARLVEHVGSTSVPGLPAKPIVDVLLVVVSSSDEAAYVPALERAGYALHLREPEWHEHRMFKRADEPVHLHVFSEGSTEIARMLRFRDRLRADATDRALYLATKRRLAERDWERMQAYADAKDEVVAAILTRA